MLLISLSSQARSGITRGQLNIVAELFASGDGVPKVRKQVLEARLDLDVADQLERRKIFSVLQITAPMIRSLSTSLEVSKENLVWLEGWTSKQLDVWILGPR